DPKSERGNMTPEQTPEKQDATQAQPPGDTYVATLNIKAIGCEPRDCFQNKSEANPRGVIPLCKIWGRAVSLKHGENRRDNSAWTALSGKFGAINLKNNQVYNSGKLFLPQGIQDIIESGVVQIQRAVDAGQAVEGDAFITFALELRSKTAENPIGYTYEAMNLIPPRKEEEPDRLRDFILHGKSIEPPVQETRQLASGEAPQPAETNKPKQSAKIAR
ncbi:MAG: hypothetical protein ACREO5_00865, partial [Candidatus Binatia bacterium]